MTSDETGFEPVDDGSVESFGNWLIKKANSHSPVVRGGTIAIELSRSDLFITEGGHEVGRWPTKDVRVEVYGANEGLLLLGQQPAEIEIKSAEGRSFWDLSAGIRDRNDGSFVAQRSEAYSDPVLVFNYPGRTQEDAAALFARHAKSLAAQDYRPVSQSWGEGRPGIGRVLAIGIFASSLRPNGFLTVTYQRVAPQIASPSEPIAAQSGDLAGRLTQLAEVHRLGLITDDEFAAKRADLIAGF